MLNALLLTIFLHQGNLYIKWPNTSSFIKLDMLIDNTVSLMFLSQGTILAKVEKDDVKVLVNLLHLSLWI